METLAKIINVVQTTLDVKHIDLASEDFKTTDATKMLCYVATICDRADMLTQMYNLPRNRVRTQTLFAKSAMLKDAKFKNLVNDVLTAMGVQPKMPRAVDKSEYYDEKMPTSGTLGFKFTLAEEIKAHNAMVAAAKFMEKYGKGPQPKDIGLVRNKRAYAQRY